eukprot:TRINITY_DN19030_c0_g1_i1.p1 TRINITY_DN19030_c0_g1~~TRINITY_DN19030_c0_g1_i1.p1  ORF type:complete len:283 (+),score=75.19 TRINITY_DN19030_c0_g1_i1:66-851(+)
MLKTLFGVLAIALAVTADDDPSLKMEGVTDFKSASFQNEVEGGNWLIEFYAPWCGWCKKLVPTWTEMGKKLADNKDISVGKFDATQDGSGPIAEKYGVQGFPTIILIKKDGSSVKFTGSRTTEGFVSFLIEQLPGIRDLTLPGEAPEKDHTPGEVLALGRKAEAVISDPTKNVFVKFFAPWCGHCRKMAPDWVKLAEQMKNSPDTVIAEVDADKHGHVGEKYQVRGFPTIVFFPKSDKSGKHYHGTRDTDAFLKYLDVNAE